MMDAASSVNEQANKKQKVQNVVVPKTATALQKMKLDRLMENPDKLVVIPDRPKDKKTISAPEFVRNVMGSVIFQKKIRDRLVLLLTSIKRSLYDNSIGDEGVFRTCRVCEYGIDNTSRE